jgi:hypothetical protein
LGDEQISGAAGSSREGEMDGAGGWTAHIEWMCDGDCGKKCGRLRVFKPGHVYRRDPYEIITNICIFESTPDFAMIDGLRSDHDRETWLKMWWAINNAFHEIGVETVQWVRVKSGVQRTKTHRIREPRP